MSMRYYEYLSAAKINMLYPQIDQTSRSAGGEIGVDIKVFKMTRKTDGKKEPTLYEKVTAIEEWLYTHESVGTIDAPAPWLSGRIDLAEAIVRTGPGDSSGDAVLFAGTSPSGSRLLMGGSALHLDRHGASSEDPLPRVRWHGSREHEIVRILKGFGHIASEVDNVGHTDRQASYKAYSMGRVMDGIRWMLNGRIESHTKHCEFLAKRLQTMTTDEATVTLATPLFVALAD
jgi:hypothetical protein